MFKHLSAETKFEATRSRLKYLSWLGVLGHPLYYVFWSIVFPQAYEGLLVRLVALLPIIGWLIWDYKIKNETKFFIFYSYSVIACTLPFFFTYMYLMNEASPVWLGSLICCILYLALIVDLIKLIIMFALGSLFAFVAAYIAGFNMLPSLVYLEHLPIVAFALLGGITFKLAEIMTIKRNNDRAIALAGTIAHELRTPMMGIKLELDMLLEEIENNSASEDYENNLNNLFRHHRKSSFLIDSLLQNVQTGEIDTKGFQLLHIKKIIDEVILYYPFSQTQQKLIAWDHNQDFLFYGDTMLMGQVLMNLIRNALFSVAAAEKGDIYIHIGSDEKHNYIIVEDRGLGMSEKDIRHMFDRFYSKSRGGAGLGLAFCYRVIMSFKGNISCRSIEGEFTQVKISLPKVGG